MKVTFSRVSAPDQVDKVVQLANVIWTEHYSPIIGEEQVKYMLTNIHSAATISSEIDDENFHYYLIFSNEVAVGYIGARLEERTMFLSKLYVLSSERSNGIGAQSIAFLRELSKSNQIEKITLTVNRYNTHSISAYKKYGFEITDEVCADIGEGYVMDDYRMELVVQPNEDA